MKKLPVVCLMISIFRLISGKLKLYKNYLNVDIKTDQGKVIRIFRHIGLKNIQQIETGSVLLVTFKFAHLSHKVNKLTSIIPMLIIAGTPGFIEKIYAADPDEGYWQGMYQWESMMHLEQYRKSLVFRMMNRRAIPESISTIEIDKEFLHDFIESHKIKR